MHKKKHVLGPIGPRVESDTFCSKNIVNVCHVILTAALMDGTLSLLVQDFFPTLSPDTLLSKERRLPLHGVWNTHVSLRLDAMICW